jgi:hypothetical protein
MPWCTGWWTNGFTFMVTLLPYSILIHFVDCGCRAGRFKIAPLAFGHPRYTNWMSCPTIMPFLLLHIFPVKKSEAYNLTLGSSCFLSIFLDTLFRIPSPSTLHVTLRTIMESIQCICLFIPYDVHLHMLASEKVGLVTWPWAVSHPRHQQTDKAKGKDAYILFLVCLPNKYPWLFIHLWNGEYVDVICNTWFAFHKKYQQVQERRRT